MKTHNGYKTYPLTKAQTFHFFYMDRCPKKEVVNVGTSLTIEYELDFDVLKKALHTAIDRCEAMRLRFVYDNKEKRWYQYVVEKDDRDFEVFDFSKHTMEEAEAMMTAWTRIPFNMQDSPMSRIVLIKMPDGNQGMYLLINHLILDAQSMIMFMKDVIEIYCNQMFEGVEYPKEMRSYIEQLEKDLEYEAGSKAQQKDREFFQNLIEQSEPIYNGIDGPRALLEARKKNPEARSASLITPYVESALDVYHLEEEPTARLLQFCEDEHISLQCLLIMGIRTYLQKANGNDDVSINVAYARRATISEKKSGGTRIHSFPFRTIISEDKTFLDGIHMIRDGQNEIFRHVNYDPVEYFAHRAKTYPIAPGTSYEPMSLTYQPMTSKQQKLIKLGDVKYKTKWYPNGATTQAMYLTVMHRPDDNGLDFNFEHQIMAISKNTLDHFYYYMCRIMFKGIENPNMKIGDIIKLT